MRQTKIFWPTWLYWFKSWIPFGIALLVLIVIGIQNNIGTPSESRAIGGSILMLGLYFLLLIAFAFRRVQITDETLFIRTPFKSYFWAKDQIEAINFFLDGKDSDRQPYLSIFTAQESQKFNIQAFDHEGLEDALELWLGDARIGLGAVRESSRIQQMRETDEIEAQRDGETKAFVGGPLNILFPLHLLLFGLILGGIGYAVTFYQLAIVGYVIMTITLLWVIWWLPLWGKVYLNRDQVLFYRWGRTEMVWWRDVVSIDFSYRYMVLHTKDARLVIPGPRFWGFEQLPKTITILARQLTVREIPVKGSTYFVRPPTRNAGTDRTFQVD